MFENLTERLTGIFNRLSSKGRLTDKDIDEALSLVRRSLLEADVNFRVARDFVARVKERAQGAEVLESLTPGQQVVKIVPRRTDRSARRRLFGRLGAAGDNAVQPAGLGSDAGGPAGLRQDHHCGQAGLGAAQTGPQLPAHRRRPAPSCGHTAA